MLVEIAVETGQLGKESMLQISALDSQRLQELDVTGNSTLQATGHAHGGRWVINSDCCRLAFRKPSSNLCVPLESTIINLVLITCVNVLLKKKESAKLFTKDKLWRGLLASLKGVFLPETRQRVISKRQRPNP